MKYKILILFLAFVLLYKVRVFAMEAITLTGTIEVEKPLTFNDKIIVIEKNTKIKVTKDFEFAFHIKKGKLIIKGTDCEPVIITGTGNVNEDSNIFFIEDTEAEINSAMFKNCGWCLHIHNSKISITNSIFENNYGGIRFFQSKTSIKKNLLLNNYIAMRFIQSNDNNIENNIFKQNRIALFLREGLINSKIRFNVFIENTYDFYAGFFQETDLHFPYNYFLSKPSIFDKTKDKDIKIKIDVYPILMKFPDWH
jgi:parallel beta-helix repeat protein